MGKSNAQETAYLELLFNNTAMAGIGDASGVQPSASAGSLYVALYTTDPTDADTGSETTYLSYARVAVARNTGGWTVSGNTTVNTATVEFPSSTGTEQTITHFGIRTSLSGGVLVRHGALTSSLLVSVGDTPKFNAGDLIITED